MLRNYAKRVLSVRYNSTSSGVADIDALLERVKNLTKNVETNTSSSDFNALKRNKYRAGGNNEGRNYNRSRYQSSRAQPIETPGAPAGIHATQNVRTKRASVSGFDSSIGEFMVAEGFDAGTTTKSSRPQLTDAQKAGRFNSQGKSGYARGNNNNNYNSNRGQPRTQGFRGDRPPRKDSGNRQGSRMAPGLQNKSRNGRNPRDSRTQSANSAWAQKKPTIKFTQNHELLDSTYNPDLLSPNTLLERSPLLSNDPSTRVIRALRESLKNSGADFLGSVKGQPQLVDIKPFEESLKTEPLKNNARIVATTLNSTNNFDYATKMRILGPLIGTSPVKELQLNHEKLQK